MSTTPLPTNQVAAIINEVVAAFLSGGETAAEAYLTALDPALLSIPFVQWILDWGVQYVGQIISVAGQQFATKIVIAIQTDGEQSNVVNGATALQLALGSGDQTAINQAAENLKTAYGALFSFDGVAPSS